MLLAAVLALVWVATAPRRPATTVPGATAFTSQRALPPEREMRRQALLDRYARSSRKLDSLERDTLARGAERTVLSRLLREAHTRRDHTQYAIDLLGYSDTTDPTAWEVARARAQDSLDSMEQSLRIAQADTLQPEPPGPPPSQALQEAARSDSR